MITYEDLVARWGRDWLIHFPLDTLGDVVRVGPEAFPPAGALPIEVLPLFSALFDDSEPIRLFTLMNVSAGAGDPIRLIVLGAAPDNHEMLFTMDPSNGVVGLLYLNPPGLEVVNSSFALFVEFLYHAAALLAEPAGAADRVARARTVRAELEHLDPPAFTHERTWWSMAFDRRLAKA